MAQELDPAAGNGGTAMTAVPSATGLDAFAPKPGNEASRGVGSRLLDYSAHAAMIVGLIGFAWTVGDHVVHRPAATGTPVKAAERTADTTTEVAAATSSDPITDLRNRNRELAETVHALRARLDALQASVGDQVKVAAQVRVLQAGLDTMKSALGDARGEEAAALARLDGKIDKVAHDPAIKAQQLADRLGKLEHVAPDPSPTASLPHADKTVQTRPAQVAAAPIRTADAKGGEDRAIDARPVPRPTELKPAQSQLLSDGTRTVGADAAKPPILTTWVVRDVYQGVALLEGRRGTLEVVPGVAIPGAGVVKSIDRHGSGWTVTTTKGLVAYAAPPHDYRRVDRGPYGYGGGPDYRYDF